MKFSRLIFSIVIINFIPFVSLTLFAAEPTKKKELTKIEKIADNITVAKRKLELAQLRLHRYDRVEYPTTKRRLRRHISLLKAEVKSYKYRLGKYRDLHKFSIGSPVFLTIENMKLQLLKTKLRLENDVDELSALEEDHQDRCRQLLLEVEDAKYSLKKLVK